MPAALTQSQLDQLKLLRAAAAETLPDEIAQDSGEFSYIALRELVEAGMMTGVPYDTLDDLNHGFLNPRITLAGRDRLVELEQIEIESTHDPTGGKPREPWHKRPVGDILMSVLKVLASAGALAAVAYLSRLLF